MSPATPLLGDYPLRLYTFPNLDAIFKEFQQPAFRQLSARKKFARVNQLLLTLIQKSPEPSFLLAAIVEYIDKVNEGKLLKEPYHFSLFEFWLNHFSGVSDQEGMLIRSKIVGKSIPRDDYQAFFPIGMGKVLTGTHFVTAHISPDVDTTIASFWGWVDAFAARVGTGQHLWSLPGGPPESPVMLLFRELFGQAVFSVIARIDNTLSLVSMDLVNKTNVRKERGFTSISTLDHGKHEKAVLLIDEHENFVGDWHSSDVEMVRQIVVLFKSCLHWFENNVYYKMVAFFGKSEVSSEEIPGFLSAVFDVSIRECEPARDFSEKQKEDLDLFLKTVIKTPKGLDGTFANLSQSLDQQGVNELSLFKQELETLKNSDLFDHKGHLIDDRPKIFNRIERIIDRLNDAILRLRNYAERLDVTIDIKTNVLHNPSDYVTMRSDVEDIRSKMKNENFITVVIPEEEEQLFPVGVIWANDLRKPILGTVSLRDFCNSEEIKMASYLSVISIVDHHKSDISTLSTPLALIGDTQSCNVLIAEQELALNRRYSTGGITLDKAEKQLQRLLTADASTPSNGRLLQRAIDRKMAYKRQAPYFIHPDREFAEALCLLHAILDDTDLLTKVSNRDVFCTANLLNRMKSLQLKEDVEIVAFDDLPLDKQFARTAAKRLLQNEDLYSVYRRVFSLREEEVETQLKRSLEGDCAPLFLDTKEQNGCCRVGQTKLFSSNFPTYNKASSKLKEYWYRQALNIHRERNEIDLHLHMISTIPSAEEVYTDTHWTISA